MKINEVEQLVGVTKRNIRFYPPAAIRKTAIGITGRPT